MRQQRLGERLRALILATPLIVVPGCFGGPPQGPCPTYPETHYFPLTGTGFPRDGGDCVEACNALWWEGPYSEIVTDAGPLSCEFLLDGGVYGPQVLCSATIRNSCGGRRPASLIAPARTPQANPIGVFFAEAARLESASVRAFRVLGRELSAYGAPAPLIRAARRAAMEEVQHARFTQNLARRYGAIPLKATFTEQPSSRSLEEIATENAVEGCVRETYDAAVGLWQGLHAMDPVVASAMRLIGDDEVGHAELGWEVARWIEPRLTRPARRRTEQARASAFSELAQEIRGDPNPVLIAWAGFPPRASAEQLLSGVRAAVGDA